MEALDDFLSRECDFTHSFIHEKELHEIFETLKDPLMPKGTVLLISMKTNIKEWTLCGWRAKLLKDAQWNSGKSEHNCKRTLSNEIEDYICGKLIDEYISKELYYSRYQFRYIGLSIAEENHVKGFKAKRSGQRGFLSRHGLSFRRPHLRRRTEPNDGLVTFFIAEFDVALAQYEIKIGRYKK